MRATSIHCLNCGYRLATVEIGLPEAVVGASAPTYHTLLMRVTDAASCLGVSRTTLYGLIAGGEPRVVRIGRSIRVPRQELERLAQGAA